MNVRLISGQYGGRIIAAPGRDSTHAMSERARGAMFNTLGSALFEGARVLDAFAGSGSLGFEAISRGAASATFVERDHRAATIIRNNAKLLGCEAESNIVRANIGGWIDSVELTEGYDVIFADPPYDDLQLSTVGRLLGLLKPNGTMILSHPGKGEVPLQTGIVVVDNRSYGTLHLTYFRREM